MHCFAICCVVSVLWLAVGYSLAFGDGGHANAFIGGAGQGVPRRCHHGFTCPVRCPRLLFFMFQMTFAIITPALIVGAYPERVQFSAVLFFSAVWLLVVYAPVTHWVWGGGWLAEMGVLRFRRRHCRPRNRRCFRAGSRLHAGHAAAASPGSCSAAAQPGPITVTGAGHAVGRLVRLQCGQRAGR